MNWTGDLSGPDPDSSKVLAIVGATAVGKSRVAVATALRLHGEIISLDSRQIYCHMPIGTAQPTDRHRAGIPHHLYGVWEPGRSDSSTPP